MKTIPTMPDQRPAIGLEPSNSIAQGARKILSFYFAEMLSHEPGTRLGEDPEALHDMRVCSRRLRAVFDVFHLAFSEKASLKQTRGLRRVGRSLGKVRDWDVFIAKAQADIQTLQPEDQASLAALVATWQAQSALARQKMIVFLDSKPYSKFLERFSQFVQTENAGERPPDKVYFEGVLIPPVTLLRDLAPGLLYARLAAIRAYDAALVEMPAELDHTSMAYLHALRIDTKRLHYTLDFLKEILGAEARTLLKEVKALQDHLGDLHDADVARISLENLPPSPSLEVYLALKRAQRQNLFSTFPQAWQKFNTPENRSLLASAVGKI